MGNVVEENSDDGKSVNWGWYFQMKKEHKTIEAQCFPLYSVLLALNRTQVDYWSLDVEGHELKVLQTVPWDKVNIKVYG